MPTVDARAAGTFRLGDLEIVRMGFGAMRLTGAGIWGEPDDPRECARVLRRALELGVNFVDTADSYGPEISEGVLADTLYPYPAGLVLATKGGLLRDGPGLWRRDGRPEHLRRACEGSLLRLRLERIDLYQLHAVDPAVPLEDSLGALADLQREGKIRHIGLSNVNVQQLERARALVEVVSVQNRFNLFDRKHEPVLARCTEAGLAFLPWAPVSAGKIPESDVLDEIAGQHGASRPQIALAWLLARSPSMVPIPGTASVQHLEENVGAVAVSLEPDELAALDDVASEAPAPPPREATAPSAANRSP